MIEREELTAGSTWHAAGGFHAMNSDTRIAELQKYTIGLYPQVEQESGQSVGLHMSGGMELAGTPERWQWLKSELDWLRTQDTDAYLLTPDEAVEMVPIIDPKGLYGGLFDPLEGNLDPNGATQAYAGAARKRGAEVIQHNRVLSLTPLPSGGWRVETEQGTITAEHIVNAAGLWARKVGNMVGVDHPLVPMVHHYLVTDEIPEVAAIEGDMAAVTDLEGFTYLQREGNGVLLGVYERNPRHWKVEGADWDFGRELFPEELDRIMPELSIGFERFPVLQEVGIKRWVNGAFTFTPDGNPLVGPVSGIPNYWAACGVHGGVLAMRGDRARRGQLDRRRRPGLRRVRHGRRALRSLRLERPLPVRDDGAVLRAPLRHGLPERGAPRGAAAQDHAVLRHVPGRGRAVHRELGTRGAAVLRALARVRGGLHPRPIQRRADSSPRRSRPSGPPPAPTRSPSTRATR